MNDKSNRTQKVLYSPNINNASDAFAESSKSFFRPPVFDIYRIKKGYRIGINALLSRSLLFLELWEDQ